jgi:hypothetical protein
MRNSEVYANVEDARCLQISEPSHGPGIEVGISCLPFRQILTRSPNKCDKNDRNRAFLFKKADENSMNLEKFRWQAIRPSFQIAIKARGKP